METHHEQETESYTIPECSLSQEEIDSDRKNDAELGLVDLTINELWESFRRDSSIEADFETYSLTDAELTTPVPKENEDEEDGGSDYMYLRYETLGVGAADVFNIELEKLLEAAGNAGTFGDYIFSVSEILAARHKSCRTALDLASARFYGTCGVKKDAAISTEWQKAVSRWSREVPPYDKGGNEKEIITSAFQWVVLHLEEWMNPEGNKELLKEYAGREASMPLKVLGLQEADFIFEFEWVFVRFGMTKPSLKETDIDLSKSLGDQSLRIFEIYAAQSQDPSMAIALAQAYTYGLIGGIRNKSKAVKWYETAASMGSRNSMTRAGLACLMTSPVNILKAMLWILNARNAGDEMAKEILAFELSAGDLKATLEKLLMNLGALQSSMALLSVCRALELYFDPVYNKTFASAEDAQLWRERVKALKQ